MWRYQESSTVYFTDAEYRVNGNSGKWIQGFCRVEQQKFGRKGANCGERSDFDECWVAAMELSCFKSVPISMILRLRWSDTVESGL